ncbi:MAG: nitronate monooxygenase [Deltaproteobacteria bacterium]|nr:nitronate monooxygenase [Deltaproteobacteria bacterium]
MKTRITEMLGIKYPIIQGAMSWVSFPPLVAAVSNAGGLGILGAAFMKPDMLRDNIRQIKTMTDKPFGVNFMPDNPEVEDLLDVILEEKAAVCSYGRGNPKKVIERTKAAGILSIPTMGSLRHAIRAEQDGADALIVQGTEGGGHTGHVSTMVLTPVIASKIKIPIIAAGGIADARGLVAALALGAEGVSMGSRFIVTQECTVPPHVKEYLVGKNEEDTVVTDNLTGVRCRVIKNGFAMNILNMVKAKVDPQEMMLYGVGRIRKAFVDGDLEWGSMAYGQSCGLIRDIPTCKELMDTMVQEAEIIMHSMQAKIHSAGNGSGAGILTPA